MKGQKEKIVIVGFGWVGQANALSLKITGSDVYYFDVDTSPKLHYADKYSNVYKDIPTLSSVLEKDSDNTWYVICVGDKVSEDGYQDIFAIEKTLEQLKDTKGGIVLRSTILPKYLPNLDFDYYVPEFLHEKFAVEECAEPYFFVLGSRRTPDKIPAFLLNWEERSHKVFRGTPEEASTIKYLSNIWNALRIAFVNEFGDAIREPKTQGDIDKTSKVLDYIFDRKSYLRYGKSFAGHCLPKDMRAFLGAYSGNKSTKLLRAVYDTNLAHKVLEDKYQNLPEWYSSWDNKTTGNQRILSRIWRKINSNPLVLAIRKQLRFIKDLAEKILLSPSLKRQRNVWNNYAIKNHRYYMNPNTKSGQAVSEDEFKETGKYDFKEYFQRDDVLQEIASDLENKVVLEIGSGSGRMTEFFSGVSKKVYGIDISDKLIDIAKERLGHIGNIEFKVTHGDTIPLIDNSVDVVFSHLTLQNIPDEESLLNYLKEIKRVMHENGVGKIQIRTGKAPRKWIKTYGVSLSPREARKLFEINSLSIIKHQVEEDGRHLWLWFQN